MSFERKKEYFSIVEKRNAIGIWSKKALWFKDLGVILADSETAKAAPISKFVVASVTSSESSPTEVTVEGSRGDFTVRFPTVEEAKQWVTVVSTALVAVRQARNRCGLPQRDPRNGLKFVDVPIDLAIKFSKLEKAVLFWFSPVKKFGAPSRLLLGKKSNVEDRVAFISDRAFYLTKPSSEITRCIKLTTIRRAVTNVTEPDLDSKALDWFVALEVKEPDYDVLISCRSLQCDELVQCLSALNGMQKHLDGGYTVVRDSKQTLETLTTTLRLERPSGFSMKVLQPTQREDLKKALDEYSKKHGVKFSENGSVSQTSVSKSPEMRGADASFSSGSFSSSAAAPNSSMRLSPSQEASKNSLPSNDPLSFFLAEVGCPECFFLLYKQNVDLDILECMDSSDLQTYGITNADQLEKIAAGIQNQALLDKVRNASSVALPIWPGSFAPPRAELRSPGSERGQSTAISPVTSKQKIVLTLSSDDDDDIVSTSKNLPISLESDDDLDVVVSGSTSQPIAVDDDDI